MTPPKTPAPDGTIKTIADADYICYDGYWIRYYTPPPETLLAKKQLIDALTRRTFHHTEAGINTPGEKLDEVRAAFVGETDLRRKRVNAAMLAGALFNRATDIFTAIVDLEENGIDIHPDDELMRQCAACFSEALELSGNVKHHSGEEGVDELWGEPGKVFTMTLEEYYHSRYRKIAQALREIDNVGAVLHETLCRHPWFADAGALVDDFMDIAKQECQIFRSDPAYYKIWPEFVADGEKLREYLATIPADADAKLERHIKRGTRLLRDGKDLITWIANVRVPMPSSTDKFVGECEKYRGAGLEFD